MKSINKDTFSIQFSIVKLVSISKRLAYVVSDTVWHIIIIIILKKNKLN